MSFRPKFKMTREDIMRIISALVQTVQTVGMTSNFRVIRGDPDDNIIINTAHDGNANYIVSGDKDILDLRNFQKIRIVSVDEMLKILE